MYNVLFTKKYFLESDKFLNKNLHFMKNDSRYAWSKKIADNLGIIEQFNLWFYQNNDFNTVPYRYPAFWYNYDYDVSTKDIFVTNYFNTNLFDTIYLTDLNKNDFIMQWNTWWFLEYTSTTLIPLYRYWERYMYWHIKHDNWWYDMAIYNKQTTIYRRRSVWHTSIKRPAAITGLKIYRPSYVRFGKRG